MFYLTFSKRKTLVMLLMVNICIVFVMVFASFSFKGKRLDNYNSRKEYIEELGYSIDNSFSEEIKVIVMPTRFSDVYIKYNELQKENGFDLEKYKGFEVTLYTLKVFDNKKQNDLYAHIILHNGYLIGGDIASVAIDGYMKGLKNAS